MWIINCFLLIIGSVAAVMGISFYWRNKEAVGNMRFYICSLGVCSALWCITYGMIGITENLALCDSIRKVGVVSIAAFLSTEAFLVTEISGARRSMVRFTKIFCIVISLIEIIVYSPAGTDLFMREGGRTTWIANPASEINHKINALYILLMFIQLITYGIIWLVRNKVKRLRRFLTLVFVANFSMLFFTLPDTFLPEHGYKAVATSGIGAAACAIVMWYGATRLSSFDIRMGSIKDKVFDFIDAGIIVFDTEGRAALANRYATERKADGNINGDTLDELFLLTDDTSEEILKSSNKDIYAVRLWNRDKTHAYSVRINAVKDSFNETFCYMCVFIDVTEEVDAIRKFEIASEAKSRFLAQMSHEIRTPINAVLGMNEMILREEEREDILEYSKNIDSSGKTLLALINSILDFSKIEDGKMDIIPVKYDTASFINDLVNSVIQRADAKGLAFEANIDENLPSALVGDDVRFSQIIMNLLTNAVKYTPKGTVSFTMQVSEMNTDTVMLYVSVKDTGIGIKEEDRAALFESFERLDKIRNHNIEGTGLGISIVTSLLQMMGSKLEVHSIYGEGSDFRFWIRQGIADDTPIGDYRRRLKESYQNRIEETIICAPKARVLVVDDNDMNRKVCSNLLKLCHIKPDVIPSGEETIERMRRNTYDIVLLDHMMPGMDGIDTIKKLIEDKLIPNETAIIALTANAVVGARETYLAAGFTDYLSKPVALKELEEMLLKYLPKEAFEEDTSINDDKNVSSDSSEEFMEFSPDEEFEEFYPDEDMQSYGADEGKEFCEGLKKNGINVEAGMGFAAGDAAFYKEMLSDYCNGFSEKSDSLQKYFTSKDVKAYEVLIHAIKSNSKSIGADEVAKLAAELENAASEGQTGVIEEKHKLFMEKYKEIASVICKELGIN